jgi:Rha family phage regulatory protein
MGNLVSVDKANLTTTSKIICDVFGKVHRNVMRDINLLECSEEFKRDNFVLSHYVSPQNKKIICYDITRLGALYLMSGFNGSKAAQKKERAVIAFNTSVSIDEVINTIKDIDVACVESYVYVAQECTSKRFKVGISKHPEKRVRQLNTGNPEKLTLLYAYKAVDGFGDEVSAHKLLSAHSLLGEWFSSDADLSKIGFTK